MSHCPHLTVVEQSSFASLPRLTRLSLSHNPALQYFHPGAVAAAPKLAHLGTTQPLPGNSEPWE